MDASGFSYEHKIPSKPASYYDKDTPIPSFTATGRPFNPSTAKHGSGLEALGSSEAMGGGEYPNYLPRRYTDDSIISIPVLPTTPDPNATTGNTDPLSPSSTWSDATLWEANSSPDPIQYNTPSTRPSMKFWRRKSSSPSSSKTSPKFVMKNVTRGDYLKYYAKDEKGWYIGTEPPAMDCILRQGADVLKWRKSKAEQGIERAEAGMTKEQKQARRKQLLVDQNLLVRYAAVSMAGG